MRSLAVEALTVRTFRNLAGVEVDLGPRFNVLSGDNGQGKTNVLEALYVLATSRSFRTVRLSDLVTTGAESASVRGRISEGGEAREQTVGLRTGVRVVRVDGRRPATLASYAVATPVVVFHAGSVALASGGGSERRKLLDRVALYEAPGSLGDVEAYGKAVRARQRALEARGAGASDLDAWEEIIARHGIAVSDARSTAAKRLGPEAERAFSGIGPAGMALAVHYRRASPRDPDEFRSVLLRNRARDRARRSASVGPHRDDVELVLSGRPVREMASQGQQRAVVLALELAEMTVVGSARGVEPILLMDDVSSELDERATRALFAVLRSASGQVLVTTTRRTIIDAAVGFGPGDRRDFRVTGGGIAPE